MASSAFDRTRMLYFHRCQPLSLFRHVTLAGAMSKKKTEWESLRALDPQALSSIHQRYYSDLLRLATYRIGDRMVAEDLASEVFIRLIDALRVGKGPTKDVRRWLLGTVNHLVNDHYRSAYRQADSPLHGQSAIVEDPVGLVDAVTDARTHLQTALHTLTDEQQMVISLRFGAEMTLEETARVMGKNSNAIKALQFRATAALRKSMEKLDYE